MLCIASSTIFCCDWTPADTDHSRERQNGGVNKADRRFVRRGGSDPAFLLSRKMDLCLTTVQAPPPKLANTP